jgi:hypothetical protein
MPISESAIWPRSSRPGPGRDRGAERAAGWHRVSVLVSFRLDRSPAAGSVPAARAPGRPPRQARSAGTAAGPVRSARSAGLGRSGAAPPEGSHRCILGPRWSTGPSPCALRATVGPRLGLAPLPHSVSPLPVPLRRPHPVSGPRQPAGPESGFARSFEMGTPAPIRIGAIGSGRRSPRTGSTRAASR